MHLMHFVAAPGELEWQQPLACCCCATCHLELDALELEFAVAASGPTIGMELQLELEGLVAGQT